MHSSWVPVFCRSIHGALAATCVADIDGFGDGDDHDLAVADYAFGARAGDSAERVESTLKEVVVDGDFECDLLQQVGFVFVATVGDAASALSRIAGRVGNRHFGHTDVYQCFAYCFEPGWLYDGDDQLHVDILGAVAFWASA